MVLRLAKRHCGKGLCLALGLNLFGMAPSGATPSTDLLATRVPKALQALQHYKSSHSLADIETAVDMLDGTIDIGTLTPQNFVGRRRTIVQAWAEALKVIEQSYDPTFDPNDPKNFFEVGCLPLTVEASERPPAIVCNAHDVQQLTLQERTAYAEALQANAAKHNRYNHYNQLVTLDLHAMSSLEASLDLLRDVSPPERRQTS